MFGDTTEAKWFNKFPVMFISAKLRWVGLWFQFNGIYQHVMTEICGVFEFDECMGSLPWKKKYHFAKTKRVRIRVHRLSLAFRIEIVDCIEWPVILIIRIVKTLMFTILEISTIELLGIIRSRTSISSGLLFEKITIKMHTVFLIWPAVDIAIPI